MNGESLSENLNAFRVIVIIKFLTAYSIVGFRMIIEEMISFVMNLVPYLNTGVLVLNINLGGKRLGFKIKKRDYGGDISRTPPFFRTSW
jgi:hypothetical protein